MDDYDYSAALDLFDMSSAASDAGYGGASGDMSMFGDAGMATVPMASGEVNDMDVTNWLAQNYPDLVQGNQAVDFGQGGTDGGIVNGIMKGWNSLGSGGQIVAGSALVGGLSNYMQQRQRDSELQQMGAMSEEQFNRQLQLKRAPVNKVANVDHFKGVVNSLRGGR